MNLTSEEIALHVQWDEVRTKFVKAKENRDKDPDTYAKAKKAMSEMRTYWRRIQEAVAAEPEGEGDATAKPSTIETKSTVNEKG